MEVQDNITYCTALKSNLLSLYQQLAIVFIEQAHLNIPNMANHKNYHRVRSTYLKTQIPEHIACTRAFLDLLNLLDPWSKQNSSSASQKSQTN